MGAILPLLDKLFEKLLWRRSRIRELVEAFRHSDRRPFPNWGLGPMMPMGNVVGFSQRRGLVM